MQDMINCSSELFKANYFDSQGWNQHQQQSQRDPISYSLDRLPLNRKRLRHFSANDRRIRNSSYSSLFSSQSTASNYTTTKDKEEIKQRRLRFDIVLEAATAITQKAEESTMTYLNRGQTYGIQLNDRQSSNETISSTLSIAFHSFSHRKIAENYWKFWISQQKQTDARAIDIDASQSMGITNVSFPSFDKISFDWNGKSGCKLYVRFKCLSTDFSRIKGVKGIPLRTQMESTIASSKDLSIPPISEVCFCKVKLFRDKGAERKNKDDAKQISKQLEKVYGEANEQSLPLMYNVSLPYSVFGEIPTSSTLDSFEHAAKDPIFSVNTKHSARYHSRVMTAPSPMPCLSNNNNNSNNNNSKNSNQPISPLIENNSSKISTTDSQSYEEMPPSPIATATLSPLAATAPTTVTMPEALTTNVKDNCDFYTYLTQQQEALTALPIVEDDALSPKNTCQMMETGYHQELTFEEDLPPLSADTLYTATSSVMHASHMDYHDSAVTTFEKSFYANTVVTPDLVMDPPAFLYEERVQQEQPSNLVSAASIYDVFTPEEIQQPPDACSITPSSQEVLSQKEGFFCSPSPPHSSASTTDLSLLQQQLQLHNETASSIMLSSNAISNMLLLSSPPHQGSNLVSRRRRAAAAAKRQQQKEYDHTLYTTTATNSSNNNNNTTPTSYTNSIATSEPCYFDLFS